MSFVFPPKGYAGIELFLIANQLRRSVYLNDPLVSLVYQAAKGVGTKLLENKMFLHFVYANQLRGSDDFLKILSGVRLSAQTLAQTPPSKALRILELHIYP